MLMRSFRRVGCTATPMTKRRSVNAFGVSRARSEVCSEWSMRTSTASLLEGHLHHCVREAIAAGGPEADAKITEAADAVRRLVRS
jgi:hypothetical protein